MTYLAHTAHAQLCALWVSCVGWTLTAVALGLIQWRIWQVSDREIITSGEAWVGIWRACFNSHTLVTPGFMVMHCKYISLTEAFTPPEIVAGQVLMLLSLLLGLCGNASGVYALRNVYFGMQKNPQIRVVFFITGGLCLLAAGMSLIPLVWNINSVVTNQTIKFPPEFRLPPAPDSQQVGCGIGVGMVGTVLMIVSGIVFCTYRLPVRLQPRILPALTQEVYLDCTLPAKTVTDSQGALTNMRGSDNPAFEFHEHL
ncbi:claudin-34-like [Notolabrus celidotus]|uniref:claudin-34-like n=1 Tax=Notolabrus celidotus TaxID=1203425 RepID=UPI0014905005|nr:claudin-34-like [Notolabrus celidotus]